MLVLSRKETQRIRLGDSIVITIVLVLRDELEVHDPPVAKDVAAAAPVVLRHSA